MALSAAGCGGNVAVEATGTPSTATTAGSTTATEQVACSGLDFCSCSSADECKIVYAGCICQCDYACPGEPPCACACGGGPYLGCAPTNCPGPLHFDAKATVSFDDDGCPYVADL